MFIRITDRNNNKKRITKKELKAVILKHVESVTKNSRTLDVTIHDDNAVCFIAHYL